jgi:hypothetical protein
MFREKLGGFFPTVYNVVWLVDFTLTVIGAFKGVFRTFRDVIRWVIGEGYLTQIIAILFVIISILVIPQIIPFSSLITKFAMTAGILTAIKYKR